MEDNKLTTPIKKLIAIFDTTESIPTGDVILLMKDIIISQDKKIIDLELSIDTLQRQIDRK